MNILDLKIWIYYVAHSLFKKILPFILPVSKKTKKETLGSLGREVIALVIAMSKATPQHRMATAIIRGTYEDIRRALMRIKVINEKVRVGDMVFLNSSKKEILATKEVKGSEIVTTRFLKGWTSEVVKCLPVSQGEQTSRLRKALNPSRTRRG